MFGYLLGINIEEFEFIFESHEAFVMVYLVVKIVGPGNATVRAGAEKDVCMYMSTTCRPTTVVATHAYV